MRTVGAGEGAGVSRRRETPVWLSLRANGQPRACSKSVIGISLSGARGDLQGFVRDLAVDGLGLKLDNAGAHVWSFRWPRDADPQLFQSGVSAAPAVAGVSRTALVHAAAQVRSSLAHLNSVMLDLRARRVENGVRLEVTWSPLSAGKRRAPPAGGSDGAAFPGELARQRPC